MKLVFSMLGRYSGQAALLALTVLVAVFCNLGLPALLAEIINFGIPAGDMDAIVRTGVWMVGLSLLGAAANAATGYFAARVSMGLGRQLRGRVFTQVQYFSRAELDRFSTSSLMTRTGGDVIQVQNFLNMFLRVVVMAPVMCVGGIVLAYLKSRSMSTVLLISMPVMLGAVLLIARWAMPRSTAMQQKMDRLNQVLREKLSGIRVIRAFTTEDYEARRFSRVNRDYMENAMRLQRIMGLLTPVLTLVLYGTTVALLALGGQQQAAGMGISTGDVIAVIQYVMQIMMAVMMLAMVSVMYPRAAVSARRMAQVLDTAPSVAEPQSPAPAPTRRGTLCFQNVSFHYPDAQEPALEGISFETGPGEITAIIGATGSGKSTLLNLIPRFYDVTGGQILVDGLDVRQYRLDELRGRLGYVPQRAQLFRGTIAENIAFGSPGLGGDRVARAAEIAQAADFIAAKDGAYDAPIAQGGVNVSGGQRQRLSIARAVARRPALYLFDDSFSALDLKTDAALRRALFAEARDAAVVLVAQRVSSIQGADRILVLEEGRCVGLGSHETLLSQCQVYREIVQSQTGGEQA